MRVSPLVHIHNGFSVTFLPMYQSGLTHILLGLAHLRTKRLFSNKHKEVVANKGRNKGASETKLCSHVEETSFFMPILFCGFPQKVGKPTCA